VSVCVRVSVCMSHYSTNFFLREKVHIVSARHIFTFWCVEMAMCLKFWDIVSARVIFRDRLRSRYVKSCTHTHTLTHTHTHTHTNTHTHYIHTHTLIHTTLTHIHSHTYTYTLTHTTLTHIHIHTHTHTRTLHSHTHTHLGHSLSTRNPHLNF